ncbi:MAG: aminofutalosine synthase MqnE [Acidobacteriaceae bacterium]|nr:aminofutalosine synthase MqnE [Acidobacteriaceae bacterium]MBV9035536.1 aminofutalosine synthase MqnE [Acidobacteriaceae bacterium]MBV9225332.1 aminofutalosine synthase MqnE [Acidobacteriaceae bacterium]MBV9305691.1 aminofutalosine synthase MqnE [Acidobacteriaceae bacterium]MBV9679157.1 aminofutalosine synthase MqnE [Acidobacteriaceae bacterium]
MSSSMMSVKPQVEDRKLRPILEKVEARERLSFEDGVTMYRSSDILSLGYMANLVRERWHGDVTYFNVNRHINPTDVCVASCRLCAFGKKAKDPKSYTMSMEQVWEIAGKGYAEAVTEFHIVGGLHPELTLDWFCEMIAGLKERYPGVHLKAFTMVEIAYFAKRAKISIRETLQRLKAAGVDSMPGGGAEVFSERVRRIICDHKIDGDEWLQAARIAHELGIKSNCTMLYGHLETAEDLSDHLVRLRALQDETNGFVTFIPLAFHPANTALSHLSTTSGFDDLKQIAISRLMLDNIPHIKAYWIMMTPGVAQIAQRFGANDVDGTVVEEKIYHDAGATTAQHLRRQDLLRLIREAGREPVERDTSYRPVTRTESAFTVLV